MLPLNFAILKLFEKGDEYDVKGVMEKLSSEYSSFRAFTVKGINESLMSAEKNGMLDEVNWELDTNGDLCVFYKATDYGYDMIKGYIK
jgi:hypothetical protein